MASASALAWDVARVALRVLRFEEVWVLGMVVSAPL
jgi:hypothetical protein